MGPQSREVKQKTPDGGRGRQTDVRSRRESVGTEGREICPRGRSGRAEAGNLRCTTSAHAASQITSGSGRTKVLPATLSRSQPALLAPWRDPHFAFCTSPPLCSASPGHGSGAGHRPAPRWYSAIWLVPAGFSGPSTVSGFDLPKPGLPSGPVPHFPILNASQFSMLLRSQCFSVFPGHAVSFPCSNPGMLNFPPSFPICAGSISPTTFT